MEQLPSNQLFAGRYKRLYELGQGGMGQVWKCYDTILKKEVALKVLLKSASDISKQRFQKEAKALARLKHKNIVEVLDFGITDSGDIYMVMEYVGGIDLKQHIENSGSLAVDEVVQIASQILDGLRNAHKKGFVHRDIKPSNILLSDDNQAERVKIVDFGTVKIIEGDQRISNPRSIIGSPMYISPEAVERKQIDPRSDIYSLGCLIYECLTGRVPFKASNPHEIFMMHVKTPPPDMENVECPFFQAMVGKCLEKDPEDRYQSADEMLTQLIEFSDEIDQEDFEYIEEEPFHVEAHYGKWAIIAVCLCVVSVVLVLYVTPKEFRASDPVQKPITERVPHSNAMVKYFDTNKFRKKGECIVCFIDASDKDLVEYLSKNEDTGCWALKKSNITDSGISKLNREKLYQLNVFGTEITDRTMTFLSEAKNLRFLDLRKCYRITPEGFEQLADLPHLKGLCLEGSNLDSSWVDAIKKMKSLNQLNYGGNLSRRDIDELSKNLDLLTLKFNNPDEAAVKALYGFKNLRDISIEGKISGKSIEYLLSSKIESLFLGQAEITKLDMQSHLSKVVLPKKITFHRFINAEIKRYFRDNHPEVKILISEVN